MKTRILILAVLTVICTFNTVAIEKEITLDGTKSISELLGDEASTITRLKISGPIRSEDFLFLNAMITIIYEGPSGFPQKGLLRYIDLYNAEVSGDEYMEAGSMDFSNAYFPYSNGAYEVVNELILPKTTTRIKRLRKVFCRVQNVTIPKNINSLDFLQDLPYLQGVKIDTENPYFEDHNGTVYTKGGEELLYNPPYSSDVTIYNGTKIIGENSMKAADAMVRAYIPTSVKIFKHNAMYNFWVNSMPEGVTDIGHSAFNSCFFNILKIPKLITKITANSFVNSKCDSIIFHEGVKEICDSAFYNNNSRFFLKKYITLPSQIEKVGDYSFYYMTNSYSAHVKRIIKIPSTLKEFGCGNIAVDDEIYLWSKDPKLLDFSHASEDIFLNNKIVLYVPADSFDDFYNYQMEDGTFPYRLLRILRKFNPGVYPQFYYASVDGVDADAVTVTVTVSNGVLSVANGKDGDEIKVYSVAGALMATGTVTGNATQISLPEKGAYIVTVGNRSFKVVN